MIAKISKINELNQKLISSIHESVGDDMELLTEKTIISETLEHIISFGSLLKSNDQDAHIYINENLQSLHRNNKYIIAITTGINPPKVLLYINLELKYGDQGEKLHHRNLTTNELCLLTSKNIYNILALEYERHITTRLVKNARLTPEQTKDLLKIKDIIKSKDLLLAIELFKSQIENLR